MAPFHKKHFPPANAREKGADMNSDVQQSVDAKTHYFDEYLIVPDGLRPEVDAFCAEVIALGEQCADFNTFEDRFASEGLSEKFVALICQCAQKASPQTREY